MFNFKTIILSTFTILTALTTNVFAADDEHHEFKKNIVGVFAGFTSVDHSTEATFGVEYEYRFTELVGVGAVYEHTSQAHHGDGTSIYMALLHVHPWQELRLSVGYGTEDIHHEGAHSEDVLRFGVAYDFHVGEFGIAPAFNLDRVGGHTAKVFGVALTKAF